MAADARPRSLFLPLLPLLQRTPDGNLIMGVLEYLHDSTAPLSFAPKYADATVSLFVLVICVIGAYGLVAISMSLR